MCQVFVPKRNVICYVASQSHMTCMLVKLINDHGYKVLLINRTRYHVPPGFIGEESFRAKKNWLIHTVTHVSLLSPAHAHHEGKYGWLARLVPRVVGRELASRFFDRTRPRTTVRPSVGRPVVRMRTTQVPHRRRQASTSRDVSDQAFP